MILVAEKVFGSLRMLNSSLLKGSVYVSFHPSTLLEAKLKQHTVLTTKNLCSLEKIGAFLISGTLPGIDSYCALEAGPWNITTTGPLTKKREILEISSLIKSLKKK
jgi:hypothetical protein